MNNTKKLLSVLLAAASLGLASPAFAYTIAGLVFCDANLNGIRDTDEAPLPGIPVQMVRTGGPTLNTTTDASGNYSINGATPGMDAGEWTVTITVAPGASIVAPAGGSHVITLALDNAFVSNANFAVDDPSCRARYCGDGLVDEGEQCDDGNTADGDGCSALCTIEQCGNGVLDAGEQCDDGNLLNGDGCSATCETETGGEGCTPGYWRQVHHFDSYPAAYPPSMLFVTAFGVDAFPGKTLAQATRLTGGGLNALGRHAVAALLNAASEEVEYDRTPESVIASFQSAYASGDYEFVKNLFAYYNEQYCPLN